jgi:type VI secretion system protein ImpL
VKNFFKKKWVIQLLGINAVSSQIWFLAPLIAVAAGIPVATDTFRLSVVIVMVVLWGLNNLRIQLKANRANAQMATDLVSPSGTENTSQNKDADADVAKICPGTSLSAHQVLVKPPL